MVEFEQFSSQNALTQEKPTNHFQRALNRFLCRLLDITASTMGLLMLSPLFVLIALKIKADSPGPVYYRGLRMGRNGVPFEIIKFRTMYEDPQSYQGAKVTAADDPRITPFGKWLRDTKLNELPQLFNILKGEMSLVGPRPEDVDIARQWTEAQQQVLLSVRPGLTSPASVVYRNEESLLSHKDCLNQYFEEILPDKMRLDMLYVLQRNMLSDIDVIFCTLLVLLPGWRKHQLPRWELYYGPLTRFLRRYLTWFFVDFLLALFGIAITSVIYRANAPLNMGWGLAFAVALLFAIVFGLSNYAFKLYAVEWSRAPSSLAVNLAFSAGIGMIVVLIFQTLFYAVMQPMPFMIISVAAILTWGLAVVIRYRERLLTRLASYWLAKRGGVQRIAENVLVIGAGRNASAVEWLFNHSGANRWFRIVGAVDDQHAYQQLRIGNVRVLGTTEQIPEIVKQYNVGFICFAIQNISLSDRVRILNLCNGTGVRTVEMPDFFGIMGEAFNQENCSTAAHELHNEAEAV